MITLVSFASKGYYKGQQRLTDLMPKLGISHHMMYNDDWLKRQSEYAENRAIFDAPRGAGYWAWKPLILLDAMRQYPGDTIIYLDSSIQMRALLEVQPCDVKTYLNGYTYFHDEMIPRVTSIGAVNTGFNNSDWTKRDCFFYMGCEHVSFYNCTQVWAGVVIVKPAGLFMVEEWWRYAQYPQIITDQPNVCGLDNLPGFVEHRHDQSILTNLIEKFGGQRLDTQLFYDDVIYDE